MRPPPSAFLRAWLTALLGVLLGSGCTPDFDEPWLVKDLRILAISANPPEVILPGEPSGVSSSDAAAWLAQLDLAALRVNLDVLAVDPERPDRAVDWEIWACSAEESFCKDDAAFSARLVRSRSTLSAIRYTFTPTLPLLLAAFEADPFRAFGGLPLTLEVRIDDGEREVRGFKRLVYTFALPYSPVPRCKQANRNPLLQAIQVNEDNVLQADAPLRFEQDATVVLDPLAQGARARRRVGACPDPLAEEAPDPCVFDPSSESREYYWVVTADDPNGGGSGPSLGERQLCEFLSYDFYTTAGELSNGTTGGTPSPFFENKKIEDPTVEWTAPETTEASPVRFWVVIRDDRGGTSWVSFAFDLGPAPD